MAINDAAEDSPDSLDLKKRARRRLVGAVALALLGIIVLPIVMDSEPKPVAQDIQVRIPSQDAPGLAAKVISGKTLATPLPAVQEKPQDTKPQETPAPLAEAKPESAAIAVPRDTAKSDAKADNRPEVKSDKAESKPKTEAKADSKAEKPADKAKAAEKTTEKAAPKKTEEVRAAAALEGKSATSGGQWVVQLGAYQNAGNVKLLLGKLKELGVPAYTEKLEGPDGGKTRVRAGPFASKDEAEKAQARIKIIGVTGPVGPK